MYKIRKNQKLKNITPKFSSLLEKSWERSCDCDGEFIKNGNYYLCSVCGGTYYKTQDYSFFMVILGMKGSGKTRLALSIIDKILEHDDKRKVAIWSDIDISKYKSKFSDRFYKIELINALIGLNDILLVDHLGMDFNSRKYITFERYIGLSEMRRNITFFLTQDGEINKDLLIMADIVCFKRLTKYFINNRIMGSVIRNNLIKYNEKLANLKKNESVLISELHYWNGMGILYNNLKKSLWNRFLIKIKRCI